MKVDAWIQMGCERREVTFDVTEAEIERVGEDGLENYIEEAVTDWWACRYGYGWTCELFENDFSSLEDSEAGMVKSRFVCKSGGSSSPSARLLGRPPVSGGVRGRGNAGRPRRVWS